MDKSLAYIKTPFGSYALTKPISREGLPPKNLLVRMSKEKEIEHAKEIKEAKVSCVKTKTGANFCIFKFDNVELEGMEMCRPVYEFKKIIEEKEAPTIEECRAKGKNDFLIISCKPKEFCKL